MKENIIQEKSFQFAKQILIQFKTLQTQREFIISKQLLRSGTAIGALVEEAIGAESPKDFVHKMSIAYKEARETKYWIRLLHEGEIISNASATELLKAIEELLKIIGSIQTTMKSKIQQKF